MKPVIRCAIYTRKSTDEGLEQEFNSLDAQREACEAYITSQKHEGWKLLPAKYDDGGFSGGNMDRPALRRLLADIDEGKVNVVVVYKVDRLTRSLADFAKIVETFDKQGASFVSVTQQFNTTSSMGRLTLNVLLSFAQFEREVTGERIRDKVAASKAKGMWMGGAVPLGYDVKDKKLIINPGEAKLVRHIFERYLAVKSLLNLTDELNEQGHRTKHKPHLNGRAQGGYKFCHGHVQHILKRKLYTGLVVHKGKEYRGEHEAIISQKLWDAVQKQIADNTHIHRTRKNVKHPSLLIGKIFDTSGKRLTGSGSRKDARWYRYYETPAEFRVGQNKVKRPMRLPAADLDKAVCRQIAAALGDGKRLLKDLALKNLPAGKKQGITDAGLDLANQLNTKAPLENMEFVRSILHEVRVGEDSLSISLSKTALRRQLGVAAKGNDKTINPVDDLLELDTKCGIRRFGLEKKIILPGENTTAKPESLETLKKALVRAHIWREQLFSGDHTSIEAIAKANGTGDRYTSFIIELSFMAPKLIEDILDGKISRNICLQSLIVKMPITWDSQIAKIRNATLN